MKDYFNTHAVKYEPPDEIAFDVIDIMHDSWGELWSQQVLNQMHAFRPSFIRVTRGETKTDFRLWRITVYIDRWDIITSIQQEVEIGNTDV